MVRPHLTLATRYVEPCAGKGYLVGHLERAGHVCAGAFDLPIDARSHRYDVAGVDVFITNPPWNRAVLHEIIVNLSDQAPAWLLIDADWIHTKQSVPHQPRLRTIVSIGRVRWIPDSPYDGKDNCAWHLFDRLLPDGHVVVRFFGRADSTTTMRRAA